MIADLVAYDADERPVLAVEVRARALGADLVKQLLDYLEMEGSPIPFGMVVDLDTIRVLRYDCSRPIGFEPAFRAEEILGHYDPEFGRKRIYPPTCLPWSMRG